MFHAVKDMVVPTKHAKKGFATLQGAGCDIQWKSYPIPGNGHNVSNDEMQDVIKQIGTHLPKVK